MIAIKYLRIWNLAHLKESFQKYSLLLQKCLPTILSITTTQQNIISNAYFKRITLLLLLPFFGVGQNPNTLYTEAAIVQ